jgi:hypothetical protein
MVKRHEVFPSRFLKEADLGGKPLVGEIERAPQEELGSGADKEVKTVLYLKGMSKALPLNMTNWDSVAEIAGDDTDNWPGHRIELYTSTTTLRGSVVPCIRIRAPRPKELLPRPRPRPPTLRADDMDDDIPW